MTSTITILTAHDGHLSPFQLTTQQLLVDPGLNDSDQHLANAVRLSRHADATVFTGLFYRAQIAVYYRANGLPEPYGDTARRKIFPEELEQRS
ncbi:hypothetical protein F8568_044900 [Actinomadura sp. LD22]|uniref:Uncharacterized protein n=1 Tax=Actinomadura physcomitrii TaxID=2650748 RepID=A0A6I4MXL0_9ACTN|nr:hypothetical protein [Actinomadura physcomitrii]MWA07349.1 hypothetical protein [Actinomadura physcomitrii]